MRPDSRWRDVPGFGDVTLRQPSPLLATSLVEAGGRESGRVDTGRHTEICSPLRERSGPLSDCIRTPELLVQCFVPIRDSRVRDAGYFADLAQ